MWQATSVLYVNKHFNNQGIKIKKISLCIDFEVFKNTQPQPVQGEHSGDDGRD